MTALRGLAAAERVMARCDELARHSSSADGIERVYLSEEHDRVNRIAGAWMRDAGMHSWQDEAGNQCGRRSTDPEGVPTLLIGSHLDTVPGAGRYDGILGVLIGLEVVDRLRAAELPFALEVVAFADEEGTRFGRTLLGSHALAGTWDPAWLELRDEHGTSLRDAALAFGIDPERIGDARRERDDLVGYLEAHIEQGPRLEDADLALGVVTSIAAAERRLITFRGEARHSATPWELRRDALQGAAEAILSMDRIARQSGAYATIGHVRVEPDAVNVVPGLAEVSLDLRHETAAGRDLAWQRIRHDLHRIGAERDLDLQVRSTHAAPEVVMDAELRAAIAEGVTATGSITPGQTDPRALFSVAGHDAMAVASLTPVAMLFTRCAGGISHHRDESVRTDDVALAIDAMETAVLAVARRVAAGDPEASGA